MKYKNILASTGKKKNEGGGGGTSKLGFLKVLKKSEKNRRKKIFSRWLFIYFFKDKKKRTFHFDSNEKTFL